ncbi:MAG: YbaK/EbsC family protein, partial [Oscillospiraceae bacterium]
MAEKKTNVMRILEKEKINYKSYEYDTSDDLIDAISVAKKLDQNINQVFKTLVTVGNSKNNFVFVVPAGSELDLKKAAKSVGEKNVEMIKVADINKTTGYIRGGCS